MPYKKYVLVIAIAALMVSSCTMSYTQSGAATPVPTKPFTNPLPTGSDPMKDIENFATATAMAKTAIAGGGSVSTITPTPLGGLELVPSSTPLGGNLIPSPTNTPSGNLIPSPTSTQLGGSGGGSTSTPVPVTGRPASYTLQAGEFPYCIARRFNVNPEELLALNGLVDGSIFMAGTTLRIPQTGFFPGARALRSHPTTYTVTSSNETFYSVACLFGDVDPAQIAQANGLSLGSVLNLGQAIKIP